MQASLLCVDDEPNILNALKRLFRPHGYAIQVAGGGAEGLAALERAPADLVISDMRMPQMSGAQFLEQVRARWPETVRILLTGYSDIESTVAAINAGQISRYVSKPWNDEEMLLIVREALERKRLLEDKRRLEALTQAQNEQLKTLNGTLEHKVEERTAQLAAALKTLEAGRASLHRSLLNSVRAFANVLKVGNPTIAAHGQRVAERARALAQRLGCTASEAQDVAVAGLLHDLGKLSLVGAAQIAPAGSLVAADAAQFERHPEIAAELLAVLEPTQGAAGIVRAHHERFDGTGFPDRLRGTGIPLGARVLAVVDEYDEALSGLLLRAPLSAAQAMRHLREHRGTRFDPAVVEAFEALYGAPSSAAAAPPEQVLRVASLVPGMVLARDLVAPNGKLLLVKEYALDRELIDGLANYERSIGVAIRATIHAPRA